MTAITDPGVIAHESNPDQFGQYPTAYTWYDPTGTPSTRPPAPAELAALPEAWVNGLAAGLMRTYPDSHGVTRTIAWRPDIGSTYGPEHILFPVGLQVSPDAAGSGGGVVSAEMLDGLKALVDEKHEAPVDLIHEQCPAGGVGPGRECTACSAAGRAYLIGVEHVQAEVRALLAGTRDARRDVWNEGYAKAVRDNGGSVTTPAADPGNPYRPEDGER